MTYSDCQNCIETEICSLMFIFTPNLIVCQFYTREKQHHSNFNSYSRKKKVHAIVIFRKTQFSHERSLFYRPMLSHGIRQMTPGVPLSRPCPAARVPRNQAVIGRFERAEKPSGKVRGGGVELTSPAGITRTTVTRCTRESRSGGLDSERYTFGWVFLFVCFFDSQSRNQNLHEIQ